MIQENKSRIFITGDCHGNFNKIFDFCEQNETTIDDIMIIAGDAGINYFLDCRDVLLKRSLAKLPITLVILHGNHEERAWNVNGYKHDTYKVGKNYITAWVEEEYPNLLFLDNFYLQHLNDRRYLFLGGAYSIDKEFRLMYGYGWFPSEQMSQDTMDKALLIIQQERYAFDHCVGVDYQYDYIVSHTCPLKYEPTEMFLPGIDQSKVDKRTEEFLNKVEEVAIYDKWFCGHYHCQKEVDRIRFIYNDIIELE